MSAPLPGTPYLPPAMIVSDTFTGAGNLTGRTTDSLLGGTPAVWYESNPGYMTITDGVLQRTVDGSGIQSFNAGTTDAEVGLKIVAPTLAGTTAGYIDGRRSSGNGSNCYRVRITSNTAQLSKRVTNITTGFFDTPIKYGDTVALRCLGNQISMLVNGAVIYTVTDSDIPAGNWFGFSNSGGLVGVDNFYIQKAVNRP